VIKVTPQSARLVAPNAEFAAAYIAAQRQPKAVLQALRIALHRYLASNMRQGPYQQFWMVAEKSVVGRVSLRRDIGAQAEIGHIAYEVFPDFRRRGFGHRALALGIEELNRQGVRDLLIFCEADNLASVRIIEAAGGVLERSGPLAERPDRLIHRYQIKESASR
jgi:predicted acetyltransferase